MFSFSANQRQRFQKIILIFLLLLLSVALIITWNTPATGYEASIYRSTPLILWVSLLASVIAGMTMVVVSIAKDDLDQNFLWKIGLLLIVLSYIICLSLFIIRGYYMWCMTGDPATHIGWITETIAQAYAPKTVIYPITHIFLSEISLVTNLNLVVLHKILPLIFGVLCVVFIYIFSRYVTSNRIAPVLAVIISCTFIFGWYINLTPNHLSNLLFPLVLFLIYKYLKEKTAAWALLLIIAILLYPVFHPVPAIFLGLIFLSLWIPEKIPHLLGRIANDVTTPKKNFTGSLSSFVMPLSILIIWFIFWISMFSTWGYTIRNIYNTISAEGGPSKIGNLMDQISYAQGYGYNVVEIILKEMIGPLIIFILTVLAFILLWKKYTREQKEGCLFSLYGPFGIVCAFIAALYFFNLAFGPLRLLTYATMIGTVLSAYLLSCIIIRSHEEKTRIVSLSTKLFVILLLSGLFAGGLLNLYPSPYNLTSNYQTTKSEVEGMSYFFSHRDVNIPITGITVAPGRFADLFLTPEARSIQRVPYYLRDNQVPWHFGYDTNTSLASYYEKETNLIITQKDRLIYTDLFPDMAEYRFVNNDFERLRDDSGISLTYSNGDFDIWNIAGGKKAIE